MLLRILRTHSEFLRSQKYIHFKILARVSAPPQLTWGKHSRNGDDVDGFTHLNLFLPS